MSASASDFVNLYGSTAWVRTGLPLIQKVEAGRLNAGASDFVNLYGSTAWVRTGLPLIQKVEAARLTAMAIAYGEAPTQISSEVLAVIGS